MSDAAEYSVYQFFPDESCEAVLRFVGAEKAVETAKRLTETLGARLGTTRMVRITDGGDHTVFQWEAGRGVTFPPHDGTKFVEVPAK